MKKRIFLVSVALLLLGALILVNSPRVHAFSIGDIVNNIRSIFSSLTNNHEQDQTPSLTVASEISLVPDGDYNQNGKITSGDIVTFTYTILNTTDTPYTMVTLKTNLDTENLNGINNIHGASGIEENNNTVIIPNINIEKDQKRIISFDAQINLNKDSDQSISTQPILINQDGTILAGDVNNATKVKVNKMDIDKFNEFAHIKKNE